MPANSRTKEEEKKKGENNNNKTSDLIFLLKLGQRSSFSERKIQMVKIASDMLNRIRIKKHIKEDIEMLKSRVRPKGHPDLKDAMFISAKVKSVSSFNEKA